MKKLLTPKGIVIVAIVAALIWFLWPKGAATTETTSLPVKPPKPAPAEQDERIGSTYQSIGMLIQPINTVPQSSKEQLFDLREQTIEPSKTSF